ncbi:GFA family protein [Rhodovulum visakhapatnamense]|uniref:CENP-V/GFA domain-containing protein n=1 Tax=Rhodovulum visakhapatnamense TaxID=364297 RepID=A0A4R8G172_9RHOB|nr:GFA family protein [Rhodovulum visakhapatnamense]TDX28822.1 hypothetical protein EV657_11016 [Rhodovulum visakhapatnamense]
MSDTTLKGHCLCGAVTVEIEPAQQVLGACHCGMCRKWTSGPLMAVHTTQPIRAEGPVKTYASSQWAERAFCSDCGSSLWYAFTAEGAHKGHCFVSAGLFEGTRDLPLSSEVYIDSKPGGYAFAGDHVRLTEAQMMAAAADGMSMGSTGSEGEQK